MDYSNICCRCKKEFEPNTQIFMTTEFDGWVCSDCIEQLIKADRDFLNEEDKIIYDEIVAPIVEARKKYPGLGATGSEGVTEDD